MGKKTQKNEVSRQPASAKSSVISEELLKDLRSLIDQARTRVAQQVNTELVMLFCCDTARTN